MELMDSFRPTRLNETIISVALFILSPIPIFLVYMISNKANNYIFAVAILLFIVGLATRILIRNEIIWESFLALNQTGKFDIANKGKKIESSIFLDEIYWPLVIAIYLSYSFISSDWGRSWIIWPIAAVLSAVISGIINYSKRA